MNKELLHPARQPAEEIIEELRNLILGRPQVRLVHAQRLRQTEQLKIGYPPELRLNLGECLTAQVPSPAAAARCQHRLRQALLESQPANLRPNQISGILHVPISEPDLKRKAL